MSDPFGDELAAEGGVRAPAQATARLRGLLSAELRRGEAELGRSRSGLVTVAFAVSGERLLAAVPVPSALRADPDAAGERAWLLTAAAVGALVALTEPPPAATAAELELLAGELAGGFLLLDHPAAGLEPGALDELAPLAFEDHAGEIDRLRARGLAVPAGVLGEVAPGREPVGAGHPLRIAEAVARLGGLPAQQASVEEHDEAVLALIEPADRATRPHEDPEPARRIARRILQRLDGMGKWGGYHTDFAHLARGFAGNDRQLASGVGEALLAAGLLAEKPSVGQRHVFLNPRRAADIHRLIETGGEIQGLKLPEK